MQDGSCHQFERIQSGFLCSFHHHVSSQNSENVALFAFVLPYPVQKGRPKYRQESGDFANMYCTWWYGGLDSDEVLCTPPFSCSVLTSMPARWLPVKRRHPWSGFWAYQGRDAFERTDVAGLNLPPTQTTTLLPLYICSCSINNCPVTHRKMWPVCSWPPGPLIFEG